MTELDPESVSSNQSKHVYVQMPSRVFPGQSLVKYYTQTRHVESAVYWAPLSTMVARLLYLGAPLWEPVASRAFTMLRDSWSATSPKTTWRPLSHEVTTVVTKNWEPLLCRNQH